MPSLPICAHNGLEVHVYHLAPEPVVYQNTTNLAFSPTSFTIISGKHEAVLVDAPATVAQGEEVAAWITTTIPNKTLTGIYVTHGHGDHFFSANVIKKSHSQAKVLALKGTVDHMIEQYSDAEKWWWTILPDKLPEGEVLADVVLPEDGKFELEGHVLQGIEVGQGDAFHSTVLYVAELDLVVGGDVVYGDCHQLFAETNTYELRQQWLASLDKVSALMPRIVVPSHQTSKNGYDASHVSDTQDYIKYYDEALKVAKDWEDLEGKLKSRFPDRDGTFILRWTSQTPFNAAF